MTDRHVNHQLPPELPPEDPIQEAAALKFVVKELTAKVQQLVDFLDGKGLLEEHAFTFPDGDIWKAKDVE